MNLSHVSAYAAPESLIASPSRYQRNTETTATLSTPLLRPFSVFQTDAIWRSCRRQLDKQLLADGELDPAVRRNQILEFVKVEDALFEDRNLQAPIMA